MVGEKLGDYMEQITLNDQDALRKRWETQEGRKALKNVLSQRFFLDSKQKIDVCNREDLISDLRGVNFSSLELKDFLLFDTDIRWANFAHSTLIGPFQDTDLSFSSFEHSHIASTNFCKAIVAQCKFDSAELRGTMFEEADVRGSTFKNATLKNAKFYHSDLRGACFEGAAFKNCVFYAVKLDSKDKNVWAKHSDEECRFEKIEWFQETGTPG